MKINRFFSMFILSAAFILVIPACKTSVDDSEVKSKVENALNAEPGVTVDVTNGVVTLSGSVADEAAKAQAEESVNNLKNDSKSGVKSVVNNITVSPPMVSISDDSALQTGVETVVKDFPGVNASVADGVITVTGSVEQSRVQTLKEALDALNPQRTDMSALKVK